MNALPVPGAIPKRVMSWEMIVVSPASSVVFGMSLMIVLRPKSPVRSWTADCRMIGGTIADAESGCRTIPNRAGSPGLGSRL